MRKILVAGLVAGAVAFGAPGAHAGSDSQYRGGCSFVSLADSPAPGQQVGEIDIKTLVYSPTPDANPVWATVECYIAVNGVPQPGTLVAGSGAVAVTGQGVVRYEADADDWVALCTRIDFTGPGDTTPTVEGCPPWHTDPPPPSDMVWGIVDPLVCPVLAAAQGTYGPVDVNEQGDVYVDGEWLYDCLPYDATWS